MKNVFLLIFVVSFAVVAMSFSSREKKVILIDVGHGGDDIGAQIDGFSEKEITLQIANKLKAMNAAEAFEIVLTRNGDHFLSYDEKVAMVKSIQPSLILSIHVNKAPNKSLSGMEIYHSSDENVGAIALPYADKLQAFIKDINHNVTIKSSNFQVFKLDQSIPTLLIELGFLSNNEDLKLLSSEEGQTQIATAILKSLM
ncbi:MAG TPA: N-acetylmuramoyl-L-alanine amidase [Taishania sp.]|nr:N-acetylmuramoyl-L-alanine amidase [Taishania sp.]